MKLILALLLVFGCAPQKPEVSETDYKRLIRYVSVMRLKYNLEASAKSQIPGDYEIFLEATEKLRLPAEKALEKTRKNHPQIYENLKPPAK